MLFSDSIRNLELVDKITITNTGNYYLNIIPNSRGRSNVELVMQKDELIALKQKIEYALKLPDQISDMSIEKMIHLFKSSEPYTVSFEYRRRSFVNKKPILQQLLREKKIKELSKTSTIILYEYIGA